MRVSHVQFSKSTNGHSDNSQIASNKYNNQIKRTGFVRKLSELAFISRNLPDSMIEFKGFTVKFFLTKYTANVGAFNKLSKF